MIKSTLCDSLKCGADYATDLFQRSDWTENLSFRLGYNFEKSFFFYISWFSLIFKKAVKNKTIESIKMSKRILKSNLKIINAKNLWLIFFPN